MPRCQGPFQITRRKRCQAQAIFCPAPAIWQSLGQNIWQREEEEVKRIVNVSGGLCSFWALHRTIEKFGKENVVPIFADVLIEAKDLYEFNRQTEQYFGIKIIRISKELTPFQLFRLEGLIGNNRAPICSIRLKREPLNAWMESNFEMNQKQINFFTEYGVCVMGFDWTEAHRVKEMQDEHPTWCIEAPMTEEPIWDKCRMEAEARKIGMMIPVAYQQGFPHNNCNRRCVRAGISHWVHLYHTDRPAYDEWADDEHFTILDFVQRGIEPLTILRDRRDGVTNSLSLRQLATRIEAGEKFTKLDWGGCGCGGATKIAA